MVDYTYLVDLNSIKFAEAGPTWIHAMPLGEYDHPLKGKIKFTPERVKAFADNVKAKVRGTDLDIDYDHKQLTTEAAGWVKDAEARTDGLWLAVEFTPPALDKIKHKAYRYFSPEYMDKWVHPKTNQTHNDVLFGGGITNRPFLKDLTPINLSEIVSGGNMLDELRKLLGLPEDADEATVLAKAQETLKPASGTPDAPEGDPAPKPDPVVDPATPVVEQPAPGVEVPANDPVVHAMSERIALLEASLKLTEVNAKVNALSEGANYAIAPAVAKKVKDFALSAPAKLSDEFLTLMSEIAKDGLVELGEQGRSATDDVVGGGSAEKQLNDKAEAIVLSEKVDYTTAVERVAESDPALFEAYRAEVYLKERA